MGSSCNAWNRYVAVVCMVAAFGLGCAAEGETLAECKVGFAGCECADGDLCLGNLQCLSGVCVDPNADLSMPAGNGNDALPGPAGNMEPETPNPDAFWAEDPPPMQCNEDGSVTTPIDAPGGTPDCPDDKNREGCPCDNVGEQAPCWPGLRANRNRGICMDGVTECLQAGEFQGKWGACEGAVLPVEGAELGPNACMCFSAGQWEIDNTSPCFITYPDGDMYAVSTFETSPGVSSCPTNIQGGPPPSPEPGKPWSANRLKVDCEGKFELCYTLRAGDHENPKASDCVVARSCVEDWYANRDTVQEFPPLPAWTGTDPVCAKTFSTQGGYGEMSVKGLSVDCESIDDGGQPYVFNRVPYCSLACNDQPWLPQCQNCGNGGSGSF